MTPLKPRWRQPVGIGLILLLIAVWSVVVVSLSGLLMGMPWPVHLIFYLVAGTIWVLPLKPLLQWMETSRWRP